jgi:hypothetical protein
MALLVTPMLFSDSSSFPGLAARWPWWGHGRSVVGRHSSSRTAATLILGMKPLQYMGDRSYSLYLWHFVWSMLPRSAHAGTDGVVWCGVSNSLVLRPARSLRTGIWSNQFAALVDSSVIPSRRSSCSVFSLLVAWNASLLVGWLNG